MDSTQNEAKLTISFYNEKVYLSDVSCSLTGEQDVYLIFKYFVLYFSRIRYLVGNNYEVFRDFENTLRSAIIVSRLNKTMFGRDDFSSIFNESRNIKPRIICTAEYFSDGKIITNFNGFLNIEFYATHSVNIFLIFVILTLSEKDLDLFTSLLKIYLIQLPVY